jgi:hypothetical protein
LALIDVTALLRPGVFIFHNRKHVVYVGIAHMLLAALANHVIRNRTPQLLEILRVRAITFDQIEIIPSDTTRARELQTALITLHDPVHNRTPRKPVLSHGTPVRRPAPSQPPTHL